MMQAKPAAAPNIQMHYSFWLVPAEPLGALLRSNIQKLTKDFDAVDFEPHVTVYSGSSNDEEARNLSSRVAGQFAAIQLAALQLDHNESYTRTLFIKLSDDGAARRMFEAIRKESDQPSDYMLDPHLSLLYKTLPAATQTKLCQTLAIPAGNYLFDRLRVIETEIPLSRPEQIRRWRTVCEYPLGLA